jgi:hypothetical protein
LVQPGDVHDSAERSACVPVNVATLGTNTVPAGRILTSPTFPTDTPAEYSGASKSIVTVSANTGPAVNSAAMPRKAVAREWLNIFDMNVPSSRSVRNLGLRMKGLSG